MSIKQSKLAQIQKLNQQILEIGRQVRILETINWSEDVCLPAIERFRRKDFYIPVQTYARQDYLTTRQQIAGVIDEHQKDADHPLIQYLLRMASAYDQAVQMLEGIGTSEFTKYSQLLYGAPQDVLQGLKLSYLEIASKMLRYCQDFEQDFGGRRHEAWDANQVKDYFMEEVKRSFPTESIEVVLDYKMSALASVSQSRVKINGNGRFSRTLARQLWFHEAEVHLLTSLNGQAQHLVSALSMSHPGSTIDQEGLASFSELLTETIDFYRLERLALRVVAIDMAINGANFVEVYQFFNERGHSVESSFYATARVFRGGNPHGGAAFTKDIVYVAGVVRAFQHFRAAIRAKDLDLIDLVFCGKINLDDVSLIRQSVREGLIDRPKYLPSWASSKECLAASLIFMSMIDKLHEA